MAHFAKLDQDNYVTQVLVVNNSDIETLSFPESEPMGIAFLRNLFGPETLWAQTSYNNNFRYNYAGPGFAFDTTATPNGAFIGPSPGEGWVLNTNTYQWDQVATPSEPPAVL